MPAAKPKSRTSAPPPKAGFDFRDDPDSDYDDDRDDDDRRPRRGRGRKAPHRGTTILVLGIMSLVACGPLGIPAWIMGSRDLAEMKSGRMDPSGQGSTQAGYICGIIGTVIFLLTMLMVVGWFFLVVVVAAR
jgi:hypothetical protein